jgi:SAM-dependent methyltransferase
MDRSIVDEFFSSLMKKCLQCASAFSSVDWRCPFCGRQPQTDGGIPVLAPELVNGDGTDAAYPFEALVHAEASHFWFRNRAALIGWAIRTHFPEATSVLEVGCGAGGVLLDIKQTNPGARLTGSELLLPGLRRAQQRLADVELVQMDAHHIPFENEFDVIGAFDVLEHIDDDESVLREMKGALTSSGGIVITVPQHQWLWSQFDEACGHRRRYTRRDLIGKLRAAGFEPLRVTSFTSFALPLLMAARRRKRTVDLAQEVSVPIAPVNMLLWTLASLERALIAADVSFPAGGSLLVVAVARPPALS